MRIKLEASQKFQHTFVEVKIPGSKVQQVYININFCEKREKIKFMANRKKNPFYHHYSVSITLIL